MGLIIGQVMTVIETLFNLANLSYLAGTLLLTRRVLKNRDTLKDYDFHGSVLNSIGMTMSAFILIELALYGTLILLMPTLLFWIIVSVYSFRNRK